MVYVIIAIIAFLILKKIFSSIVGGIGAFLKALFFGPKVNSMVTIILIVCVLIADVTPFSVSLRPLFKVLWVLSILDCIRDILLADSYYRRYGVDPLYKVKSILSLLTLGLVRGVFLFVVGPYLHHCVAQELRATVDSGGLVSPCYGNGLRAEEYYYDREVEKFVQGGELASNEDTLRHELALGEKRLEKLYPKKLMNKVVDAVAGDEAVKQKRDEAKRELPCIRASRTYMTKSALERLGDVAVQALKEDGRTRSAKEIVRFWPLEPFRLLNESNVWWLQMFLIQALEPLAENGTVLDLGSLSDTDPLDNHVYCYMKNIGNLRCTDPRLADDDLGELG